MRGWGLGTRLTLALTFFPAALLATPINRGKSVWLARLGLVFLTFPVTWGRDDLGFEITIKTEDSIIFAGCK